MGLDVVMTNNETVKTHREEQSYNLSSVYVTWIRVTNVELRNNVREAYVTIGTKQR